MAARTPAISYLRVSGKGQIEGDGFDRQRDAVARFAASNGFELLEEYRDEASAAVKSSPTGQGSLHCSTESSQTGSRWSSSSARTA